MLLLEVDVGMQAGCLDLKGCHTKGFMHGDVKGRLAGSVVFFSFTWRPFLLYAHVEGQIHHDGRHMV